ncbi:MAG: hypothetical protein IJ410_03835 [Oscillospiraceae bacterium]|nr:hypothetical protein [Oscillospiraceae bacterium]
MSLRVEWLDMFINEVKSTGVYSGLHRLYDHNATVYLYLSHLGAILGFDALHTFFYTQLVAVFACVAFYPVIFYRLSNNIYISLLSVVFFEIYKPYTMFLQNDSYWICGWITFISMPILYFLIKGRWNTFNWLWVVFLGAIASMSNVFRSSSGLAVIVSLILIILLKLIIPAIKTGEKDVLVSGIIGVVTVLLLQNLFTGFVPSIYQEITEQPESLPIKGPWHTLYIGLGWEENPLGIKYQDRYGYANREHLLYDVSEGYFVGIESPEYINEMKNVYMDTIFSDFKFFVGSYIRKVLKSLETIFEFSLINYEMWKSTMMYPLKYTYYFSFILPIAMIYFIRNKLRENKHQFILSLFTLAGLFIINFGFGMLPGIIAYPIVREYLYGAIAACDMIILTEYIVFLNIIVQLIENVFKKKNTVVYETVKN